MAIRKMAFADLSKKLGSQFRGKILHDAVLDKKKLIMINGVGVNITFTSSLYQEAMRVGAYEVLKAPNKKTNLKIFKAGSKSYTIGDIDKVPEFGGGGGKSDKPSAAAMTKMQEDGSAYILMRTFEDNKRYSSVDSLLKDASKASHVKSLKDYHNKTNVENLNAIFSLNGKQYMQFAPGVPIGSDEYLWANTFLQQHKTMLLKFSSANWDDFNRDGGFMDWISIYVNNQCGISKKDAWDPADIWLIKNEAKWKKKIELECDGKTKQSSLTALNSIMRDAFSTRDIVGISLKKISKYTAYYEEVNVTPEFFKNLKNNKDEYQYTMGAVKFNLSLTGDGFKTQDMTITMKGKDKDLFRFQIKGNNSTGFANLKYEPTDLQFTKARLGKSPRPLITKLAKMEQYSTTLEPEEHRNHPSTSEEWEKEGETYLDMFKGCASSIKDTGGVRNGDEFKANFSKAFGGDKPYVANAKLQELSFFHALSKLDTSTRDDFLTEMLFIAQKKGNAVEEFGPFGKLY